MASDPGSAFLHTESQRGSTPRLATNIGCVNMTCECGENKWKIDMDLEYCIAILTCTKCGYSESLYLENNPEELKED